MNRSPERIAIERYIILSDQQLISMSLDGDAVAFEHLFNRYRDSIFQLCVQRTGGNREDADDLLQETFLKVYMKLESYDHTYTFGQWIYTIARNTFIDYLRKKQDNLSLDNFGKETAITPPSSLPSPEESIMRSQQRAQIEQYLELMPPRYRKLVELRFFRDYSYEEIATELNIPLGTVKTQIHRARTQLCRFIIEGPDILP